MSFALKPLDTIKSARVILTLAMQLDFTYPPLGLTRYLPPYVLSLRLTSSCALPGSASPSESYRSSFERELVIPCVTLAEISAYLVGRKAIVTFHDT